MKGIVGGQNTPTHYAGTEARVSSLRQAIVEARRLTYYLEPILAAEYLSVEEWLVLDALNEEDGLSMSVLAARTLASNATLSRHVDSLATRALIFREVSFEDRRRIVVHLAKRGRMLHGLLCGRLAEEERQLLAEAPR